MDLTAQSNLSNKKLFKKQHVYHLIKLQWTIKHMIYK